MTVRELNIEETEMVAGGAPNIARTVSIGGSFGGILNGGTGGIGNRLFVTRQLSRDELAIIEADPASRNAVIFGSEIP